MENESKTKQEKPLDIYEKIPPEIKDQPEFKKLEALIGEKELREFLEFSYDLEKQNPEGLKEFLLFFQAAIEKIKNKEPGHEKLAESLARLIVTQPSFYSIMKTSDKEDLKAIYEKAKRDPETYIDLLKVIGEDQGVYAWPLIEPFLKKFFKKYKIPRLLKPLTFAIPSHPIMFTLLALFSGTPHKIPRKLLEKPYKELTEPERKKIDEFSRNLKEELFSPGYDDRGRPLESKTKITALISDSPKVEAQLSLFKEDVFFKENALAVYIKKTFRVEGLRHLLGLLIGLDENFRKGYFEWEVNEHLERLGYKKHTGSYILAQKTASNIIKLFTSIFITAYQKEGEHEKIEGMRLFSIDGFKQEMFKSEVIDERLLLRATEPWYRYAFEPRDGSSPKYTKLLKKVVTEYHVNHPLTIYLAPLLAVFWRMSPEQKFSIRNLMEWCNLETASYKRTDHLKDLEAELNYMVEKRYLEKWENLGYKDLEGYMRREDPLPSKCGEPFNCILKLTAPDWLQVEIKQIRTRKEKLLRGTVPLMKEEILTQEDFIRILENSGRTHKQFANELGISRQMVTGIKSGKKKLSLEISRRVKSKFGYLI